MERKDNVALLLSRREAILRTAGVVAFAGLGARQSRILAQSTGTMTVTPSVTEGPYWVDEKLNRSDLSVDPTDNSIQQGFPLVLGVTVSQLINGAAAPLPNAYVDLWHCNALGVYSDIAGENTAGHKWLRGYQVTNAHGATRFLTVYPGWYQGRTVHIHSRVRLFNGDQTSLNFATQFFFDDAITDTVYQNNAPYNTRASRDTRNTADGIYSGGSYDCSRTTESGELLLLRLANDASHAIASFNIVLDLATSGSTACATQAGGGDGNPNPGGGGPGGGTPPPGGPPPGGLPPIGPPPPRP